MNHYKWPALSKSLSSVNLRDSGSSAIACSAFLIKYMLKKTTKTAKSWVQHWTDIRMGQYEVSLLIESILLNFYTSCRLTKIILRNMAMH